MVGKKETRQKMKKMRGPKGHLSKKIVAVIVAAAVAGGGFGTYHFVSAKTSAEKSSEASTIRTAEVTTGTITQTVTGSGTLAQADAQDVTVPTGVTIAEVLVSSGDTVTKGQTLATIDETSIKTAISEIQTRIESVDKELAAIGSDTTDETVGATISGRVKEINIASGDDAATIMKEDGALVVISADGLMSVSLPKSTAVTKGDTVNVTLSDGTVVEGTVATISSNTMTVTIDDDGPTAGETVSVATTAGTALGSGTLEVHQPLKVTADSGTVSSVSVTENEEVDVDDALFTLTGVTDTAAKDQLLSQREDLVDALNDMIALEEDNEIVSPISGTINSVNISAGDEITTSTGSTSSTSSGSTSSGSSSSGSSGAASGGMTASLASTKSLTSASSGSTSSGFMATGFTMTSAVVSSGEADETVAPSEDAVVDVDSAVEAASSTVSSADTDSTEEDVDAATAASSASGKTAVATVLTLPVTTPQAGENPMNADELNAVLTDLAARSGSTSSVSVDSMTWNTSTRFTSGGTYRAYVTLKAADGYYFSAAEKNAYSIVTSGTATTYTPTDTDGDGYADSLVVEVEFPTLADSSSSSNENGNAAGAASGSSGEQGSTSGTSSTAGEAGAQETAGNTANDTAGSTGTSNSGTQSFTGNESLNSANSTGTSGTTASAGSSGSAGGNSNGAGSSTGSVSSTGSASGTGSSNGTASVTSGSTGSAGNASAGTSSSGSTAASSAGSTDSTASASNASASSESTDASDNTYNEYLATVFTVAPDDTMNIDISVDELDILNIKEGQSATLTIDAIDSKTFEGTVSEIDTDGTNSGGSTKYTVTLSVARDDNMLSGMSVTASILTDSAENVLTIPASALQEMGGTTFVYTSEDSDGNLSGKTEVKTGLSDDSTVEITGGLSEGQTIYYEELSGSAIDTSDDSSNQQQMGGGMMGGGQGGPGGDNGNGGGGMPQGGGPGGNS
ncbi:MAG: HlyD family efflux transporter periplasmic adaptor subunit [Lachnospiraceae bacterium]|nr:HlyD family efflux transporter periplasmic adaptor subunit [Lachnospiraceae bacterium]